MSETCQPFVTFLMCSRKKDNPDSDIIHTLESFGQNILDQETSKVEILIKFDTDDDDSRNHIYDRNYYARRNGKPGYDQTNILKKYPYNIRYFTYERGEGRRSLHNDYMFLFSQRSPSSRFIAFLTDDCVMLRKGMITELERLKNKDWIFLGDKRPELEKYQDYRNNQDWRLDVSMYPIVSTKIIECVQNMGWQVNVDNWITLLASILYHKYGLDFWEGSYTQYIGRAGGRAKEQQYGAIYNPFEVNNKHKVKHEYYFDLVEQQAKNIVLNYHEEKTKELLRQWVK